MKKKLLWMCCLLLVVNARGQQIKKEYAIRTIAFYNVENLFDTINDPSKKDELQPLGQFKGNKSKVYWDKINKISLAISQIGLEKTATSPAVIGLCEVENKNVLEDLINSKNLKEKKYQYIHYNSPSPRGIDVAFLYQQRYFVPLFHEAYDPRIYLDGKPVYTRDQLVVTGYLDNELMHFIVNHWPSRRGGEERTSSMRKKAAFQNTKIIAQIRAKDPTAKIVVMGDFNDEPTNASMKEILKTKGVIEGLKTHDLFNPYEKLHQQGYNTLGFRDDIFLFDQIIVSATLIPKKASDFYSYRLYNASVFNKPFLVTKKGRFKGYPYRSFSYGNYIGGYSDHFPVFVYLIKEKKDNR